MQVGICLGGDIAAIGRCREAGCDYVELAAAQILEPGKSEADWAPKRDQLLQAPLPIAALNLFFSGDVVLVGPQRNVGHALEFADIVLERARRIGAGIQVFGSGKARTPPEGYPLEKAMDELKDVARQIGPIAQRHGVVIAMEHLRRVESTLLSSAEEALQFVREVNHSNIQLLLDSYHIDQMGHSYDVARKAADCLVHTHTADGTTRADPLSGNSNLRPFFAQLKAAGYDGRVSIESRWADRDRDMKPAVELMRQQWQEA